MEGCKENGIGTVKHQSLERSAGLNYLPGNESPERALYHRNK